MDEKKLARDELIGLHVKIKECKDPSWVGKSGIILNETKNTFLLEINDKKKTIAKNIASFEFKYEGKIITINGSKISFRPEDRIKKVR
jgi:ribonuclease P protein subunit POP4